MVDGTATQLIDPARKTDSQDCAENIIRTKTGQNIRRPTQGNTNSHDAICVIYQAYVHKQTNYQVVREPIVSGQLTSLFQCRVKFGVRFRVRFSFRV